MDIKQLIITTMVASLMAFAHTATAECEAYETHLINAGYLLQASNNNSQGRGNDHHQGNDDHGDRGMDRSDNDRISDGSDWYKPWSWYDSSQDSDNKDGNQNSNRQSDPDSTRGQARAEERRGDKDRSKDDRPWYDPWGWFE